MHIRKVSSLLGMSMTGTTQGERLSPLDSSYWIWLSISFVSSGFVQYAARLGSGARGMRSMQCSIPRRGGSPGGSSSGKTSLNSFKRDNKDKGILDKSLVAWASPLQIST